MRQVIFRYAGILCSLVLVFSTLFSSLLVVSAQQTELPYHKVIARPGTLADQPGVTLWHDYGAFAIYKIDARALDMLPDAVRLADDMDRIEIEAYPFDTQRDQINIPASLRTDALSGSSLHLIQFVGPVKEVWLEQVRAAGATPIHYIANNAYLVWADDAARNTLSSMAAEKDFLQYSAPYHPYFKMASAIQQRVLSNELDAEQVVPVLIQIYRHADAQSTESLIESLAVRFHSDWTPVLDYQNISIDVRASDLLTLVSQPDVTWVEERLARERMDEVQNQILVGNFNADQSGPAAPGYLPWLDSFGFSQNPADYPVVDITDDGIGNGTVSSGDPTFHQFGNISNATRLAYVGNCTSESDGGGPDGHGHINTSIVGGYDVRVGDPYQDSNGYQRGLGLNPYGRMAGTRIFDTAGYDVSSCGNTDQGVILQSYTSGARISSNSWGCSGCAGSYDSLSQAYDVGTRDADTGTAGNQELLFVFSAGNSGPSSGTVGTPGNGKNMVTVGASENDRPTWTDGCGIGPSGADDAMDVISFSSRGPSPGTRVKPETIAPGTHIQGTASTHSSYNGSGVCDQYQPTGQTVFAASSGTSHSAPAVAGISSLYWYWLENTYGVSSPSPALIKAYLLAHTTYLTGVSANDTLPSNNQGYGMPDLGTAFDDADRYLINQNVVLDNSGETWRIDNTVADPAKPVRVVLVYTDKAGAIGTSPQVNDLNLDVVVDGVSYLGNVFSGQWSTTGGTADSANNYEAVFLPAGTSGSLQITVTGFNIADDGVPGYGDSTDQDFALVCYNCTNRDFSLGATPASQDICTPNDAVYDVQVGSINGYDYPVTLSASGIPAGTTASFSHNPVIPTGSSVLSITNTGAAAFGSYSIDITGVTPTRTHTSTVTLDLFTAVPVAVTPILPADGAVDVPTRPTFTWSAVTQGTTYQLEVATDPSFNHVVLTASGLADTSYTSSTDLQTRNQYYWRVRASNTCGQGAYSPVSTFRTVLGPGDCSMDEIPNIIYAIDFESGASGWTHSGTQDTWALSSAKVYSGSFAFFGEDLSSVSDQRLMSPLTGVALPTGQSPLTLQFWNYQGLEDSSIGCYDGGMLEISTDGGGSWTQLSTDHMLTDPYDGEILSWHDNPLMGLDAWCGDPQDWLKSMVDLDAYAGQTVSFRFRLGTDSSTGHDGWYIDDVTVQSCLPAGYNYTFGPDSLVNTLPATTVTHTFTLQNLGQPDSYTLTLTSGDWTANLLTTSPLTLDTGSSASVDVQVDVPVVEGTDTFTITAQSVSSPTLVTTATGTTTAAIIAGVNLNPATQSQTGSPGEKLTYTFTVENTGNYTDTFNLSVTGAWTATLSALTTGELASGDSTNITVTVDVPVDVEDGAKDIASLTAVSQWDADTKATATAETSVVMTNRRIYLPLVQR